MVLFPPSVSHLWVHLTTCGSQSQGREPGDMSGDELVNQREDSWMAQSSKWDTGRGVVHLWQPRKNKIHCVPASWKPPLAQCYGLVAAGSKSAMRRPLPLPGCGGEWKETGRNLVCRDKGSLTEWQTKGTVATTIQIRRKHNTNLTTRRAAPGHLHTQLSQFTQVVSMKLMALLLEDIAVCKTGAIEGSSIFSSRQGENNVITLAGTGSENKWDRLIFGCYQLTYYKALWKIDFISLFFFCKYSLVIVEVFQRSNSEFSVMVIVAERHKEIQFKERTVV